MYEIGKNIVEGCIVIYPVYLPAGLGNRTVLGLVKGEVITVGDYGIRVKRDGTDIIDTPTIYQALRIDD